MKSEKENEKKMEKEKGEKGFEPKTALALPGGVALVGGKGGLQEWRDGQLTPVSAFGGLEVRGLAAQGEVIFAAAKDGLWKREGAQWKQVRDGDFHGVSVGAGGAILVAGKMGVLRSADGAKWEPLKGTETDWKPHDHAKEDGVKEKKESGYGDKPGEEKKG